MFEKEIAYVEPLTAVNNLKDKYSGNISLENLSSSEKEALIDLVEKTSGMEARDISSLSTNEIIEILEPAAKDVSKGTLVRKVSEIKKRVGKKKPKIKIPSTDKPVDNFRKKNPLNQSKDKLLKMQQITEIRKRKIKFSSLLKNFIVDLKKLK
ncbi:hypothetical protein [Mangrovivirga cuniculi]|uniref:Uncharacterized protein n=1 Tax=Mangrovivirga cuniculi TaxID=2715131 RepID=A0A4D7JGU6_9BACT|nr:hypothetical protein [Mangrovivirga cuniculi]QCK14821.1 hypothetical protein DCC35_08750 [Mangrovivirga cuniculi]